MRRPHGVRGEVVVEVLSDLPRRFEPGRTLVLVTADGARRPVEVVAARPHAGALLLRLEGVDDRDAAEALRGAELEAPPGSSPAAPDGAFYYFELVGCRCADERLGELGEVTEVVEDGGGLLLRVVAKDRELLIPFVREYLSAVEPRRQKIRLRLPEGLVEACASTS